MKTAPDQFVPDEQVQVEFGDVNKMRLWRWTHDPKLGFPPVIRINGRNFRSRAQLEAFKQRKLEEAMKGPTPLSQKIPQQRKQKRGARS